MCYFIIVQMAAISLYTICAIEFLLRFKFDRPVRTPPFVEKTSDEEPERRRSMDRGIKLMLLGLAISTVFILIRSVYRTIELLDGWTGRIITTQLYFVCVFSKSICSAVLTLLQNVLDGGAIVVAMFAINIFHPGFLLRDNAKTLGRKPKPTIIGEESKQETA